jgi:hypothetical protein
MRREYGFRRTVVANTYAAVFVFFLIVPGVALVLQSSLPDVISQLLPFAVAGFCLTAWFVYKQQLLSGGTALVIVLGLIHAQVTVGPGSLRIVDVGLTIWAVGAALPILFAGLIQETDRIELTLHRVHLLFIAFAVSGGALAAIQPGPRPVISVLTAIYFIWPLVISIAIYSIRGYGLTREIGARLFVAVVAGHLLVASVQLLNNGTLGLVYLGEGPANPAATLSLLGLTVPTGNFIGGFTFRGPLAILITLSIPLMLALASRSRNRWSTMGYIVLAAYAVFILRLTRWDAGYLGTLVGLLVLGGIVFVARRDRINIGVLGGVFVAIISLFSFLSAVLYKTVQTLLNPVRTSAFHTQYIPVEQWISAVAAISVPGFSTANLQVRLVQYALGVDLLLQYPLTGIGLSNFWYLSEELGMESTFFMHNLLGQVYVGTGLIGGSLYVGALLIAFRDGVREVVSTGGDIITVALLSGFIGVHVQMMFNPHLIKFVSMSAIWIVIALLISKSD